MKTVVNGKSVKELEEFVLSIGEKKFRAAQIYEGLYSKRWKSFSEFTNLSNDLRKKLEETAEIKNILLVSKQVSVDGTIKGLFEAEPGKNIEAVWIPNSSDGRKTICISSQSGCTLSCEFCATGRLDFQGNLKTWQILDQIIQMEELAGERCTNIVFMGMGEPMHNYANVMTAAHILHDEKAFGLGAKRITISTAGVIPSIRKFIFEKQPFNFAISLNHPDPEKRKDIMGIDQRFPLKELLLTAREFTKTLGRKITFEYIMIPDVNMGEKNAKLLVKLARSVNCKINLIPLNTEFNGWRRPTEEEMEEFRNMILPSNVPILNRRSPGKDIDGACGMLSLKTKS